jgi:integrase
MGKRTTNLPPYVRRHCGGFRAVLRMEGRELRSPTFTTPEEASQWAERARATPVPVHPWTLQDGFDAVLRELELKASRDATIAYYRNHWRTLTREERGFDPAALVCSVQTHEIVQYANWRKKDRVSESTLWKELQVLGRILRLAKREGQIIDDPLERVPRPKIRTRRFQPLGSETIDRLLAAIRGWSGRAAHNAERDADIIDLIFSTGIRLSEAGRLAVEDVAWDVHELRVDGKTGIRRLPIGEHLAPILARLVARAGAADQPLMGPPRAIETVLRRWSKRLQESRLHAHALRHSFATARARAGVDPYVLRDLLGHASLNETMRYYHTQGDKMRAAIDAVPRRGRKEPPPETAAAGDE